MNPAPPKPPAKNANQKMLAAYYSQLRRWAQALERWEANLDSREAELDTIDDYENCYCSEEDAEEGCDCLPCNDWREQQVIGGSRRSAVIPDGSIKIEEGDSVPWLEGLWKLKDKRK